jgi:hypothetical protein
LSATFGSLHSVAVDYSGHAFCPDASAGQYRPTARPVLRQFIVTSEPCRYQRLNMTGLGCHRATIHCGDTGDFTPKILWFCRKSALSYSAGRAVFGPISPNTAYWRNDVQRGDALAPEKSKDVPSGLLRIADCPPLSSNADATERVPPCGRDGARPSMRTRRSASHHLVAATGRYIWLRLQGDTFGCGYRPLWDLPLSCPEFLGPKTRTHLAAASSTQTLFSSSTARSAAGAASSAGPATTHSSWPERE